MQQIQTFDLYEGSFYLSKNCSIDSVEAVFIDGKVSCKITIAGENIHTLQATYFSGMAEIRLFDFRRVYSQLQKLVHDCKRKFKNQMRHEQFTEGGNL
ncbi:MAG: hypothetical protein GY749_41820 [Desulfobacteraceae bacterium]|nr:hypothetical protein [Desulfobacteraceae bacterium]